MFLPDLRAVNPGVRTIETLARTGAGVDEVCASLVEGPPRVTTTAQARARDDTIARICATDQN